MDKDTALWHKVSDEEKQEILIKAKKIMDDFHKTLAKVEKEVKETAVERDECSREETETLENNSEFRKIMFENAPQTKDDCIEAEKGGWTG